MAGKIVDVTLRLVDQISNPLSSINSKLKNSANQWTKSGRQIQNAGKAISGVGASLTTSLTLPITTMGVACVKAAADFETGMDTVASVCSLTGAEMDTLSEKAKEMGAVTKFTAKEATEAYQYMAMAGWNSQEMLDGIEGIMYLAGATGEALGSTSDIVTDALTAFGMTAKDTTEFVDTLAMAANASNTDVSMLGESFKYCAPVAGALKYSVQDVSVALGLMANSGIKASSAGTSLRSWMSNMSAPTKAMRVAMEELGLSLTDSEGNMKGFAQVMSETRSAFDTLGESEKAAYAKTLAGKSGMSGLLAVVNASDGDFNQLTDAINNSNGACREMYDIANDNLQGQLTIIQSTLESLAISFGEILTPNVKQCAAWIQSLADTFNGLSDDSKQTIVRVSLITAAVGPTILIFGKAVTTVGRVVSAFGRLGKAVRSAGSLAALLTSPAAIVIAVLAGIAAAAFLIYKNWDKVRPVLIKIKNTVVSVMPIIKQTILDGIEAVRPAFDVVVDTLKNLLPKAIDTAKNVIAALAPVFEDLGETVTTIAPTIGDTFVALAKALKPVFETIIEVIEIAVPIIGEVLVGAFTFLGDVLVKVMPYVRRIARVIGSVLTVAVEKLSPILTTVAGVFSTVFTTMFTIAKKIINKLKPVFTTIGTVISTVAETIKTVLPIAFNFVAGVVEKVSSKIKVIVDTITKVFNGVLDFVSGIFTQDWEKAWNGVKSIFDTIFSSLVGLCKTPINAIIGLINRAIDGINGLSVSIPEGIPGVGGTTIGFDIPKIPTLAVGTQDWRGGLVQISERGGEIVDLPSGSRVYPHDESVNRAYADGTRHGGITLNIPKLADQIIVREDSDIDAIAQKLADKLEKVALNMGGAEIGYIY